MMLGRMHLDIFERDTFQLLKSMHWKTGYREHTTRTLETQAVGKGVVSQTVTGTKQNLASAIISLHESRKIISSTNLRKFSSYWTSIDRGGLWPSCLLSLLSLRFCSNDLFHGSYPTSSCYLLDLHWNRIIYFNIYVLLTFPDDCATGF